MRPNFCERTALFVSFLWLGCGGLFAQISTSTTISTSPDPIGVGVPVKIQATVTPAPPSGRVTFYDRTTILGTAPINPSGQASFTTEALLPGSHRLRALFPGATGFLGSRSSYILQETWSSPASALQVGAHYVDFGQEIEPLCMLAGDFNLDGKPDVAIGMGSYFQIYFGDGKGSFSPSAQFNGGGTYALASGDFRGTGLMDIVSANAGNIEFSWNQGNGSFVPGGMILTGGTVLDVNVADFNGDGNADVVFTNGAFGINVALGNGDGTFQKVKNYLPQTSVYRLAVADFNGDGSPDIAFAILADAAGLGVMYGEGGGDFAAPQILFSTAVGTEVPSAVSAFDFNRDGKPDLAYVISGALHVFLGNGDGTFEPDVVYPLPADFAEGVYPNPISGDFNGDGKPDIAIFGSAAQEFEILYGNGDGTFQPPAPEYRPARPYFGVYGDFNGDGRMDFLVFDSRDDFNFYFQPLWGLD